MSGITMVTLRDGSQVPEPLLITTTINIKAAQKEAFVALFDLVEKCKDAKYKLVKNPFGDSKKILQKFVLIDANEKVFEDVRKIVLNSIEGSGMSLKLVNPIKRDISLP